MYSSENDVRVAICNFINVFTRSQKIVAISAKCAILRLQKVGRGGRGGWMHRTNNRHTVTVGSSKNK